MWKFRWLIILTVFDFGQTWNIFPKLPQGALETYAKQKISTLKNLRNVLKSKALKDWIPPDDTQTSTTAPEDLQPDKVEGSTSESPSSAEDPTLSFLESIKASPTLASKESRDNFLQQILPKRDFLRKLFEIREKLEPEVKKYFTDKYNSMLNNLVPYSETIGVPPYVLNSTKIPQNFDPRWQVIKSLLEPASSNQIPDDRKSGISSSKIQSRSDDEDEQELVSDQEPDATSKGQKKYMYLAPRNRPRHTNTNPDRAGYEISFDSVGEPQEPYTRGYYLDEYPYATKNDLIALGGSHVARGHSLRRGDHGHGHGGGGGYGHGGGGGHNMVDPFSILGGLAFLTYLGLLIQQALMTTTTAAPTRSFPKKAGEWNVEDFAVMKHIPMVLSKLSFYDKLLKSLNINNKKPTNKVIKNDKTEPKSVPSPAGGNRNLEVDTKSARNDMECNHLCQTTRKLIMRITQG